MFRATRVVIDRKKIAGNVSRIHTSLPKDCRMMAVIKADGYAHGMVEVAKIALASGASWLGVAIAEEGVKIREAGIDAPILILGPPAVGTADIIISYNLRPTVFREEHLRELQQAAYCKGIKVAAHCKIDTGMHRIGVVGKSNLTRFLDIWEQCPNVEMEGIFTHFASSDDVDKSYTLQQIDQFNEYVDYIRERGYNPLKHVSNSGGTLNYPEAYFDMVRCGLSIYGYYPSDFVDKQVKLQPALQWETEIVHIFDLEEGESVSYGRSFTTEHPTRIAVLPVGYGDGYRRGFGNKAQVLVKGKRVPVVGRVCMDQCMIDVTNIQDAKVGDIVVLLGEQDSGCIDANEMAEWVDTIQYEILLGLSARVPKIYIN